MWSLSTGASMIWQQLQEHMNSVNGSGEFQDIESKFCGRLSHVSSQPEMIPCDKSLPLETWNQSGVQENALEIIFLRLIHLKIYPQRIQSDVVHRNREAISHQPEGKASLTSGVGQNEGTIPMPTFASGPLTTSSTIPVELPQNYVVGQQRQQMSELQLDKYPTPASFLVWKTRFKNTSFKWF